MKSALRLLSVSLLLMIAACGGDEVKPENVSEFKTSLETQAVKVAIENGEPLSNLSSEQDFTRFEEIEVPSGATNLQISISGGSGDADLYVRFGSQPTAQSYDCRPFRDGNSETCSFDVPRQGTYFIAVSAYRAYQGVTLNASYSGGTVNPPGPNPPTSSGDFEVTFVFGPNVTDAQKVLFQQAGARWSEIITGDIADIPVNKARDFCGAGEPAFNGTVDDVVIYAEVGPIDGADGATALAGPCVIRSGGVTSYGLMSFDSADVASVDLTSLILHEMGHVFGIGTLWEDFDLVNYSGDSCPNAPRYSGSSARSEWNALGGSGGVPVEQDGSDSTVCSHWDEETFDSELMTGFEEPSGAIPLSRMTAGTLEDLGYTVNKNAADPYSLPSCSPTCSNRFETQSVGIAVREVLSKPVGVSLPSGVIQTIEKMNLNFDQ